MKYKVKTLSFKAKNSPYTIAPGIYEGSSETQEVWDYLLKMGSNVCEVIIEKDATQVVPEIPTRTLEVAMKVEDEAVASTKTAPKTTTKRVLKSKNQIQGDN